MNLQSLLGNMKPRKPYILGKGKPNKYHPTSLDGNRVLGSGAIVVRTISVGGSPVEDDYDAKLIKDYKKATKRAK